MTERGSTYGDRAQVYARWRPAYPAAVLTRLHHAGVLPAAAVIADVGSGTGLFTRQLLDDGHTVYAVEPDAAMRHEAERDLAGYDGFVSVAGSAEETGLPDASIDLVAVAQAFHWFDAARCAKEFRRIARPNASVVLLWNERRRHGTAFLESLEDVLCNLLPRYRAVADHDARLPTALSTLFRGARHTVSTLPNHQRLDEDGLVGRVLSASYAPSKSDPQHDRLVAAVRRLHNVHARQGTVQVDYDTVIIHGRL